MSVDELNIISFLKEQLIPQDMVENGRYTIAFGGNNIYLVFALCAVLAISNSATKKDKDEQLHTVFKLIKLEMCHRQKRQFFLSYLNLARDKSPQNRTVSNYLTSSKIR